MVQAQIGYAADRRGSGVAYARLTSRTGERLVRVAFRVQRFAGLGEREIAYGAATAVAQLLRERGVESVRLCIADEAFVADINEHREVPAPIVLPYIRFGCVLNRFKEFALSVGADPDLTQRASAEVALQVAA